MPIAFSCPNCSKNYKVKDELAGKRAKCPCGHAIRVPVPQPPEEELGFGENLGALLDEVDKEPQLMPPEEISNRCPACNGTLAPNAILCVNCGHDLKAGKKLKTQTDEKQKKKSAKSKAAKSQAVLGASFIRGTIFSLIAAGLGGVIWVVVALVTGYQIGWLAWGLGAAAGAGMALGHEDDDGTLAGMVAAGCALLGLFAAKGFIYFYLLMPIIELVNNPGALTAEFSEELIATALVNEQLQSQGMADDDYDEATWDKEYEAALERVRAMTPEEIDAKMAEINSEFAALADEAVDDEGLFDNPTFFGTMFSPMDGLFILLAVASAYKLGSGTMTD